ncbi:MAG: DUF4147 domain-containing protein [Pseudomonadota bacterium]
MYPHLEHYSDHLSQLRNAALEAVNPATAVKRAISPSDVESAERIFVVGAGKAGVAMTHALAELLGSRLTAGVISVPTLPPYSLENIRFIEGGHPTPTEGSLAAGQAVVNVLSDLHSNDLVIALISGGGSALLEYPRPGLSLEDLHGMTQMLLGCGANIREINQLRICLSQLKGGGLLRLAYPASVLAFILSDVVGNDLGIIASGLTVPAPFSRKTIDSILYKYALHKQLPLHVLHYLEQPADAAEASLPIAPIQNRLIASNRLAGEAACKKARELGFQTNFLGDHWQGEARVVGKSFANMLIEQKSQGPQCFIVGGETTVTVKGQGKGGRNQELALAAAIELAGHSNIVVSTFATDGVDGPTDAAGAIATGNTLERAMQHGLNAEHHLHVNNAYPFFNILNDLITTGPTGTNVNDLLFGLIY